MADGYFRRLFDPEHLRPYARLTLIAIALFHGVVGSFAYLVVHHTERFYGRHSWTRSLLWWVFLGSLVVVVAVAIIAAVRARSPRGKPRKRWWLGRRALLLTCLAFGIGTGALNAWTLEVGAGPVQGFLAALFGTLVVSANERGRQPVLGILLAVGAATALVLGRVLSVGRLGYWDFDELLVAAMIAATVLPIFYLMIRGLLILVSGGRTTEDGNLLFAPAAFEVSRRDDGRYVVVVEAPGLETARDVQVEVYGTRVVVRAPARIPPSDGLLFSTRVGGEITVTLALAEAVLTGAVVSVARGLITVVLEPVEPA